MHRAGRKGRQAQSDVFGAIREWSRIADPISAVCDDGLPCHHIHFAGLVLHSQCAPQDHRVLVKLRSLAGFLPSFRAAHVGDANAGCRGVDEADVFFNHLGLVSSGFDAFGIWD